MDKKLEKYYEDRFSMFQTQGWKDLLEDIDGMIESTNQLGHVSTVEQLHFAKGELSILNWIKGLNDISQEAYNSIKEQESVSNL